MSTPIVDIIVINYNTQETTLETVRRAHRSIGIHTNLIVIDNASKEFDPKPFEILGTHLIQNHENRGFSKAANQGLALANGNFTLLLNSDAYIELDTITTLVSYMQKHPKVGLLGPKMHYPSGEKQVSSGFFPAFLRALITYSTLYKYLPHSMFLYAENPFMQSYFRSPQNVDWISGGAMLIRKEVLTSIGLLDERFFFGGEDLDYCYRAKERGWHVVFHPNVDIVHYHGHSSGNVRSIFSLQKQGEGMIQFMKKNFPHRVITRLIIGTVLKLKIFLTRHGFLS